jgi:membrane-associated phospholipid phosphatase
MMIWQYDITILSWLHSFASPILGDIMVAVSVIADPVYVIPTTVLLAIVIYIMRYKYFAYGLFAGIAGSALISTILKTIFHRSRPELWAQIVHETNWSMPSSHAAVSSALVTTFIIWSWSSKWRYVVLAVGLAFAFAVGLSRLYLGVHYPSDVVVGWSVGVLWALLVKGIISRWAKK